MNIFHTQSLLEEVENESFVGSEAKYEYDGVEFIEHKSNSEISGSDNSISEGENNYFLGKDKTLK